MSKKKSFYSYISMKFMLLSGATNLVTVDTVKGGVLSVFFVLMFTSQAFVDELPLAEEWGVRDLLRISTHVGLWGRYGKFEGVERAQSKEHSLSLK